MNSLILYILEVSCVFTVFYTVYFLLFRRLTFHALNRMFLLISLPISFVLPITNFSIGTHSISTFEIPIFDEMLFSEQSVSELLVESNTIFSPVSLLIILYCLGVSIFIIRLINSAFKLLIIKRNSRVVIKNGFNIIAADVPSVFSCFNWIFVPESELNKCEASIIVHEKLHATLWHTLDLIVTELFIALCWFNPVVYFFRKSIKMVHEYQVDSRLFEGNIQKLHYLQLLLTHLNSNHRLIGLYNYFNGITIKNRVKMITKNKSGRFQLIKYLIMVPVLALLALSFSEPEGEIPGIFPIREGEYSKITVHHDQKMLDPFTNKERIHKGIDIKAREGVNVLSTADGEVLKAAYEDGWGNLIAIDHGNDLTTWYAHLKDFAVETGQKVGKGQTIGQVGNTGKSTGPHLHYEVRLNGNSVNPMDYAGE